MNEYICLKCNTVFHAGESYAKCCGEIEIFSPEKHGRLLIGNSNSWISVWKKWKNNSLFKKISQDLKQDSCYGAATHLNVFIEKLLEHEDVC